MFGLGMPELILIFLVILIFFGGRRLPEIGRGLGEAISSFKRGLREGEKNVTSSKDEPNSKP